VAKSSFYLEPQEKDIGQTLGKYGIGEGCILSGLLPDFNARDTGGSLVELFLTPWALVNPQVPRRASACMTISTGHR